MQDQNLSELIQSLMKSGGIPKNVRLRLEETAKILEQQKSIEEKISYISSVLDEASNDPNLSTAARTSIWNAIYTLERR
ncbi:MAG: UPF0147 family protein [Candidatus Aenigmarchaeota archaeon]|nr:UPF0147 family protein [Candidatus Aenigmarchaeota archaeon]